MDFSNFTFRSHSMGRLMTDAKGKSFKEQYNETKRLLSEGLEKYSETANKETKTAKNLFDKLEGYEKKLQLLKPKIDIPNLGSVCKAELIKVFTEATTGRTRDVRSKYIEKGLMVEEDVITLYSILTGEYFVKNTERKYNDYVNGECDFFDNVRTIDSKASWDIFTFHSVMANQLDSLYHWQGDNYMWLWNKKKHRVIYGLINTPIHLIEAEHKKIKFEMFGSDYNYEQADSKIRSIYEEACNEITHNMTYDDIPKEKKIIPFDIEFSEERIERIKKRVEECRYYLNNFQTYKLEENVDDDEDVAA